MVMMTPEMSKGRFEDLADIYGGEIARWPEAEREAARAFLARDAARLSPVLASASQLDRLLDLAPAQSPGAALLGRLISAAPQAPNTARRWIAGLGAALGLSATAFAGIAVGVAVGRPPGEPVIVAEQPRGTAAPTAPAPPGAPARPPGPLP